jgi:hypothetical protein
LRKDGAGDVGAHLAGLALGHQVDDPALGDRHQVAHPGDDHVLDLGLGQGGGQGGAGAVADHDGFRPGVAQLEADFGRGVERVDVDRDQARAQHADQGHGKLVQVGRHDRHPRAGLELAVIDQEAGEVVGHLVELAERDRGAEAGGGRRVAELAHRLVDHGRDVREGVGVDLGRGPRRIRPRPDPFHLTSHTSLSFTLLGRMVDV